MTGYISNRRLLLSLADAGGRLMYSGKDISELVGYTSRVYSLLASLYELDSGDYLRDGVETKITEEGKVGHSSFACQKEPTDLESKP